MRLFLIALTGKSISVEIEKNITIRELKELTRSQRSEIPPDHTLVIISDGIMLEDDDQLIIERTHGAPKERTPCFLLSGARLFSNGTNALNVDRPMFFTKAQELTQTSVASGGMFGGSGSFDTSSKGDDTRKSPKM